MHVFWIHVPARSLSNLFWIHVPGIVDLNTCPGTCIQWLNTCPGTCIQRLNTCLYMSRDMYSKILNTCPWIFLLHVPARTLGPRFCLFEMSIWILRPTSSLNFDCISPLSSSCKLSKEYSRGANTCAPAIHAGHSHPPSLIQIRGASDKDNNIWRDMFTI